MPRVPGHLINRMMMSCGIELSSYNLGAPLTIYKRHNMYDCLIAYHVAAAALEIYNCSKATLITLLESGEPGLVDRVLTLHAGSLGLDSYRGTCPNDFPIQ